jgi:hypothetical protein
MTMWRVGRRSNLLPSLSFSFLVDLTRVLGNCFLQFWLRPPIDPPGPRLRRAEGHAEARAAWRATLLLPPDGVLLC